eukprot:1650972-Rhodomonas_salina.2
MRCAVLSGVCCTELAYGAMARAVLRASVWARRNPALTPPLTRLGVIPYSHSLCEPYSRSRCIPYYCILRSYAVPVWYDTATPIAYAAMTLCNAQSLLRLCSYAMCRTPIVYAPTLSPVLTLPRCLCPTLA